jgi:hypothetical protein
LLIRGGPGRAVTSSPTLFSAISAGILKAFENRGPEVAEMAARHARPRRAAIRPGRAAVVIASVAVFGVAGAGSASAATVPAAEPQAGVLGLGQLLDGLTDTLGLGTTAPAPADAGDESPSLAQIVSGLPVLGPTLGGVVDSLPLLGSGGARGGIDRFGVVAGQARRDLVRSPQEHRDGRAQRVHLDRAEAAGPAQHPVDRRFVALLGGWRCIGGRAQRGVAVAAEHGR